MKAAALAAALVCFLGCRSAHDAGPPGAFTLGHKPPERKDVIEAVLASHDVPLSVSPSCSGVGTKAGDKTIGAYLSGFLAELSKPGEKNWLDTQITSVNDAAGKPVWRCDLTIRHSAGEDEWGWGVRFDIAQADGRVVPQSFICTGGG